MSSDDDEEVKLLKKSKKKKDKKKKKQRKRKDSTSSSSVSLADDDDGCGDCNNVEINIVSSRKQSSLSSNVDDNQSSIINSKKDKKKKKKKKHKKKENKEDTGCDDSDSDADDNNNNNKSNKTSIDLLKASKIKAAPNKDDIEKVGGRIVSFSAQDINATSTTTTTNTTTDNCGNNSKTPSSNKSSYKDISTSSQQQDENNNNKNLITLLLFYQYIEPVLDEDGFQDLLQHVQTTGDKYNITGRMRTSYEGLNCTLTGSYDGIRSWCKDLRQYKNGSYFNETEFKLTDNLPIGQAFPKLHAFKVEEIVNYGLAGIKAPSITMTGEHLEPKDYHKKMTEDNTVIIDVRNHYEAAIGKFQPPEKGAKYIDPMMRKSTEFPVWLDKPETKEMLRGKQVLMYCTGGVRCERASALLRTKMEKEEDTKALGIKGVYQLQGGIDKYFRDFPEGGWWRGKNYVFDKRFAHAPPVVESLEREMKKIQHGESSVIPIPEDSKKQLQAMGQCEACSKPWDKYRGKRRCPTCGVPSLICKDCYDADVNKTRKLDRNVRCDLCVKEGITSKRQIREREEKEMEQYEKKLREIYGFELPNKKKRKSSAIAAGYSAEMDETSFRKRKKRHAPNPKNITKLFIKNLCTKQVDQDQLCDLAPGITHIEWISDRKTGNWYGSVFVEMATPEDASLAVGSLHKQKAYGRILHVSYSQPDPKSIWPPPKFKII